jgi:hypothetical protein
MNKKKEDLVLVVAGLKLLKKVLIEADNGIFAYLVIASLLVEKETEK